MMRKFTLILSFFIAIANLQAQNYEISFEGSNSETIDKVLVKNTTQGTEKTLNGGNVLHLLSIPTGVEQVINQNLGLQVYPNPMTENSSIEFNATVAGLASVSVFDITGKQVISEQRNLSAGSHVFKLNDLSTGIYTLSVQSASYLYSAKLVSQSKTKGNASLSYVSKSALKSSKSLKGKNLIEMQYNTDDRLLITASSGTMSTLKSIVPTTTVTETFEFSACTDGDGTNYPIIKIGDQTWMAKNLNTTKYTNGDDIPFYSKDQNQAFSNLAKEDAAKGFGYCDVPGNETGQIYGALYTFGAATNGTHHDGTNNVQGACPTGWHVPSDDEWKILEMHLGMTQAEADASGWRGTNQGSQLAGNAALWNGGALENDVDFGTSGFSALLGGGRDFHDGTFVHVGDYGGWWSASEYYSSNAWYRVLYYEGAQVARFDNDKSNGLSVRCVRN